MRNELQSIFFSQTIEFPGIISIFISLARSQSLDRWTDETRIKVIFGDTRMRDEAK